jgi:hypothetical protein
VIYPIAAYFLCVNTFFVTEKKCQTYIRQHLKAPPKSLVTQWGKKMKLTRLEINQINDRLYLRHHLGKRRKNTGLFVN